MLTVRDQSISTLEETITVEREQFALKLNNLSDENFKEIETMRANNESLISCQVALETQLSQLQEDRVILNETITELSNKLITSEINLQTYEKSSDQSVLFISSSNSKLTELTQQLETLQKDYNVKSLECDRSQESFIHLNSQIAVYQDLVENIEKSRLEWELKACKYQQEKLQLSHDNEHKVAELLKKIDEITDAHKILVESNEIKLSAEVLFLR